MESSKNGNLTAKKISIFLLSCTARNMLSVIVLTGKKLKLQENLNLLFFGQMK